MKNVTASLRATVLWAQAQGMSTLIVTRYARAVCLNDISAVKTKSRCSVPSGTFQCGECNPVVTPVEITGGRNSICRSGPAPEDRFPRELMRIWVYSGAMHAVKSPEASASAQRAG